MATSVHIPKVGMTMEEGELVRWTAADGAQVTKGETLFEMETEKVELEIEAEQDGTLKQMVPAGTRLKPGAVVGCLLATGEAQIPAELIAIVKGQWSETAATSTVPSPPEPATSAATESDERVVASPAARRLARELSVPIGKVIGSGPRGRITEDDVQQFAASAAPRDQADIPYRGRRRTIGERMHHSLRDSAQFTMTSEIAADGLLALMNQLTAVWGGERIPLLTPLIMKAVAIALRDHPLLNARLEEDKIHLQQQVDIGFATDLDEGLMVPVVRSVDRLSIRDLATQVQELVRRAEANRLTIEEMEGGTFTVSSLAKLPIDAFTPVLNPPQVAILGVGRLRDVVRFEERAIRAGKAITLSLTIDHRVVDGAPAGRFLAQVGALLQHPAALAG